MTVRTEDEYLHRTSDESKGLFSDNFWLSICDREADIFGVNHIHASLNKGYARFSTMMVIDGVVQPWANKVVLPNVQKFDRLSEGRMTYEVVKPLEQIRVTFDGPKYGFDLLYKGRFPVFDYNDCIGGNPLTSSAEYNYGGHYEQGMLCTGEFEVRAGPRQGRRQINSFAHRDHSWTNRFSHETPWELAPLSHRDSLFHFWPSIQTESMHLNAFGWMNPDFKPPFEGAPRSGGFLSDANGSHPIEGASCEIRTEADGRTAMSFRYRFILPGGKVIHVRTGRKYAHTMNGLMRGENEAECTLDCYESFFDYEVEETGERGYGCSEYSIIPPYPRWRY
ncbi:hypothetical protein ACG33_07885 [Steroidobacter denitrificans]|uniref:Uncharacterized protein n=1 Tax=Steroidobacter denitrificans TaxID=465721 RepID=A0A127F9C9_STEDE|nr:hypothetical protein [Steroidobacter denitrificans]AMN47017.1 hypothetical protein ACG33_07885 [Steroidobacter denitrificans]